MQKIAIIIPCYNEEKRLKTASLLFLIQNTNVDIYLANDGSNDGTLKVITEFCSKNPQRCFVLNFEHNHGKAATIFKSVTPLLENNSYDYIGYFDADFSTPESEVMRLINEIKQEETSFLIGSRILLLNSGINRKYYRHIIGRIIITLINLKFKLGIYDTQCGAKIFSTAILKQCFDIPFKTSWLFDVEIFIRLKKKNLLSEGREIPVYNWKDIDGSKLGWKTSFKILNEMYLLNKNY